MSRADETDKEVPMRTTRRHYKDVIKDKVISLRLNEEEFLRLKANALRDRTSVSKMVRERMTELIDGTPAGVATAAQAIVG
jgi:ribosomal protein L28